MNSYYNKIAKSQEYPFLIQKGESDFYYLYENEYDRPIDCKKEKSGRIFKYDLEKGHTIGEKVLAPIYL